MSRLDELKKKYGSTSSEGNNSNKSRLDKLKEQSKTSTYGNAEDFETFVNDYTKFVESAQKNSSNVGYKDSFLKRNNYSKSASDLRTRLTDFRVMYNLNRSDLTDREKEMVRYLDEMEKGINSVESFFVDTAKGYSQWKTEDEYNEWVNDVKEYEEKTKYDLDAGQKELDELKELYKKIEVGQSKAEEVKYKLRNGFYNGAYEKQALESRLEKLNTDADKIINAYGVEGFSGGGLEGFANYISEKERYLTDAKRVQKSIEIQSVNDPNSEFYDPEFENYLDGQTKADKEIQDLLKQLSDPTLTGSQKLQLQAQLKLKTEELGANKKYNRIVSLRGEEGDEIMSNDAFARGGGISIPQENGKGQDDVRFARSLTEDEVEIYTYYLNKHGEEKAEEYLRSIKETVTYRNAQKSFEAMKGNTALELISSLATGLEQFYTGSTSAIGMFFDDDTFKEDVYSTQHGLPTTESQYLSGMVREDLADDGFLLPDWLGGGSLGQAVYDMGTTTANMLPSILTSAAVSAVATPAVGQAVGSIMLGASAMGNAYNEMRRLGYSQDQARTYGLLVGASEGGLQYLLGGISSLGGKLSNNAIKSVLSNVDNAFARVAIQIGGEMASEGFEEGLQSVLEPWFKSIATGADFEAPDIGEVLYSSLLGALSAGILESGGTISSEIGTYQQGKSLINNGVSIEKLSKFGSTFSADTVAHQLAGRVNEKTGAYTIGRLFNEINAELTTQNQNDIIRSLERKGVASKDARTIATALANVVAGVELTEQQQKALESNPVIAQTINDVIINPNSTVNQRIKGYNEAMRTKSSVAPQESTHQAKVEEVDKNTSVEESAENEAYKVSEDSKTIRKSTDAEVNIEEIVSKDGGNIKVKLDDGDTVSISELSLSRNDTLLYEMVTHMDVSPQVANALVRGFNPSEGVSADTYAIDIPLAYKYGQINYSKGLENLDLTISQRQTAFYLGRNDAEAKTETKANTNKTSKASKVDSATKKGKVIVDDSVPSEAEFTDVQKASMAGIKFIADVSSLEVHVYASFVENGERMAYVNGKKRPAPNGYYLQGTNKIYIDLNAGNMGEGTMLYTLSHEVTHYIAEWNYKGFKELGDFLIENFGDIDAPVDELIDKQIAKKKRSYELDNKPIPNEDKLYDEAYEELVADAMSKMFADEQAYVKLAELKKQNKTLWQKLGEAIKKLIDKIKSLIGIYSSYSPGTKEAKWVEKFNTEIYDKLQDLYLKAFVEADANYKATSADKSANVGERKESGRDDNFDWNSEGGQLIASAMDMATCKQMIERTYRIVNPNQYEETPIYKNAEHWLEMVGADEVALYIENEYILQEKYLDKIPAYLDGDVYVAEIIEAYQAGVLKGTNNKKEAVRLDTTKGIDYGDKRFYAPKKIEGVKALYEVANKKITNANRQEVTNARAKILLFAHNRGAVEELGITQSELNKKLRTWSNYSAKARDISQRINNGVAFANKWTGIENSTYLNNATVSEEDFASLVGDISGHSSEYERRFIASTMLALDTHIDYTGIKFIFGVNNFDRGSVLGTYNDTDRTIRIKRGSGLNTVAHEIGHAIDHQWTRDVWNWSGREAKGYTNGLSEGHINLELVTDPEVVQWVKNYLVFVDNISDSSAIYNEYAMSKNEVFARFVAKFVEWTMQLATGRNQSFGYSNYSSDKFTGSHFMEFVKILQEKAKLDSKYQNASESTTKFSERDSEEELTKLREEYKKAYNLKIEAKTKLDFIDQYPRFEELTNIITDKNSSKETIDEILADYSRWKTESGYDEAYEKLKSLEKKESDLYREVERMEERLSKALREKKYSEEEVKAIVQKAVRKFHTTPYLSRASYLLTTGSMLDFSEGQGYRVKDHREISEILDLPDYAQYSDGMIVFMNMGNIRLQTYGIDISAMPNDKQISSLRGIISSVMREYDEFTVDFSKPNGNSDGSVTYPKGVASSKIISDIKKYFETGEVPEYEDSLSQFRYSDRDSLGNELSKEQQEFFKDSKVRDEDGNLLVVYHGTTAKFNTFKIGDIGYHFGTEEQAKERIRQTKGNVEKARFIKAYLNITNPIILYWDSMNWRASDINSRFIMQLQEEGYITSKERVALFSNKKGDATEELKALLVEKGYDGIVYNNYGESNGDKSYIVFNSNQAKEITNQKPTSDPDIRYSSRDSEQNSFNPEGKTLREQLEDAYSTSESFDQRYVYVGRFSNELRKLLKDNDIILHDYPIAMNYRDAYLSMHSKETGKYKGENINYHNLGVDGLEAALESFKSPLSIMRAKKEGKIELVLQGVDKKGNSLLSIVAINTVTQNGRKFLNAHIVTSVYGRRNIDSYIAKAEKEGRLIKTKKEETPQGIPQVQYEGNINAISSDNRISQNPNSVKSEFSDRDTATFNGKPFWSGSVSLLDGVIEEVHSFSEAEDADFHHSMYFSQAQIEKMENGENAFFWVENGSINGNWRESIPQSIIDKIREQIVIDAKYSDREDLSQIKKDLTSKYQIDPNEVIAIADSYMENYGGTLNKTRFRLEFLNISKKIAEFFDTQNMDVWDQAEEDLNDLAKEIASEPKGTSQIEADIKAIRKHLKGSNIKIPKNNKGDFDTVGGFEKFRKKHMGSFILANEGLHIDSLYAELQELFGLGYFPAHIINVADQLLRIAEVVDTPIKAEVDYDVDEAKQYYAYEILEKLSPIIANSSKKQESSLNINDREAKTDESNRTLLANALESVAQNDIEKNKLKQYKDKIKLIESEQAKLSEVRAKIKELSFAKGKRDTEQIRSLQNEATQIANRINTYDRQLFNLEATTALKNVLQREKEMARKKERQAGQELLTAYKEKAAKTQRELLTRYQESRKKAMESRHKTELRHKIKKVVTDLNKLLLHGTKERNVKPGLQQAVASALEAINMDTVSADARIAKLREELLKAKTPEKIEDIQHKIDHIKNMGDNMADKLEALRKAYTEIKNGADSEFSDQFKEEASLIESRIERVIKKVGNTPLRDMSLTQLEEVYEMYTMVLTTIRNANSLWKEGKRLDLQQNASAVMQEIEPLKKLKDEETKLKDWLRTQTWHEMTPYYAFDRIGSDTLTSFFMETIRGQDVYARDVDEAKTFADETRKKYNYKKWDLDKVYEFKLKDGRIFKTTLKHMLSIYAYSKRDQALLHMSIGGFFHNDKSTFRKKGGVLEFIKREESGYKIDAEILEEIKNAMTKDQLNYVDEMQEYLTKMGEKGNEVTRVIWGIDIFKEKVYFPLKSKDDFIKRSTETAQAVSLKNDGMTKETVPGASNPIVLEAFDDVWANHIERMSQYHAFVIPIDNLNKLHQYGTWVGTESMAVSTMLAKRFGSGVNEYITQFIKDLNGHTINPGAKNPLAGFLSKFKKTAVGASMSTVVQQPTAILRAMATINPKYFVGKPNMSRLSKQWAELKKYAPVAIIKDIGGFDAGSGVQVSRWLNSDALRGVDKVMDTIDNISMKGAEIADQVGWTTIWEAVKREVKATTNLEVGSEAFLKKAGERFTEVIVKTQVYDSTLSRSGFMRSKSDVMKMLTAFMGEPTLSINMMFNAIINAKRGGSKLQAARTIGFVYASIIGASAMASFIYALRDDDEDESYLEKYMQALGGEVISDVVLAPITSLPAVKDIVSIFQGWDVERTDVAIFKDIKDAFDGLDSENKSTYRKIEDFAGAIASAFGVPLKNLLRTGREVYNGFSAIFDDIDGGNAGTAFVEGITGEKKSKSKKLYEAIVTNDKARLDMLKKAYKDDKAYATAIKSALRENDSRIKEAAQARIDGNIAEYTRIAKEIIAEGNFSQDIVVSAINAEINTLNKGESTESSTTSNKVTSIYKIEDYFDAIVGRDQATAYVVKEDLIKTDVANGKDRDEAEADFNGRFASYLREEYEAGNISDYEAINMLVNYGGKSDESASSKVQYWDFKKQYPDYDLSEEAVTKYYNEVEPYGITVDVYYDYSKQRSKCKGTDNDGDGRTDSGSVKAEVMQVINSLSISSSQKDALYYLNGWSASTIWQAPWH